MPIQEIMKLRTSQDKEVRMALLLAIHCAPILSGSKAANIMTVTVHEFDRIGYLLEGTGIRYRFLKTKGDKGILYLYREKRLQQYLEKEEIQEFLSEYGYDEVNIAKMLNLLSKRIQMYNDQDAVFPHEIGVFLEYPLGDVKGFLANEGKNFMYSGYWKVYQDLQGAVRRFTQYDMERELTIQALMQGKSIREIALAAAC
ncbi:MAG TPA: DUF3793 domain-containing protein [Lachnospiraceae bacterium]|nr:DUF3793 domain-containing protein [Lachnospiraceae bacterium]